MSFSIAPVTTGRSAWSPVGGTLNVTGSAPGPYYRAPASGKFEDMIGAEALTAQRYGREVNLNAYAVYAGARAFQRVIGVTDDGVWGPKTDKAAKNWQYRQNGRAGTPDGIFGPKSARCAFLPLVTKAAGNSSLVAFLTRGHIGHESGWDPAAVGYSTPDDLGLGQINGTAHPDLDVTTRLTPEDAVPWIADFCRYNLEHMGEHVNDAIAAYLLGVTGAKTWVRQDRPRYYAGADI